MRHPSPILRRVLILAPVFLYITGFNALSSSHPNSQPVRKKASFSGRQASRVVNYGQLPLAFEPNQGQVHSADKDQSASQVQYLAHGAGYSLFVGSQESVLILNRPTAPSKPPVLPKNSKKGAWAAPAQAVTTTPPTVIRMKLVGAQAGPFEAQEKLPGVSNYFIGKDSSQWHKGIPQYGKIQSSEVYPGVDLAYYGHQGKLEYDFIVKPGADPRSVRLKYEGAQAVSVNGQGDLELKTDRGSLLFRAPSLYQEAQGVKRAVEGRYQLGKDGSIGFEVKGYDATQPLVIDPVLDYATFLGGSTTSFDVGQGIALDTSGDAYVTGYATSSDFPVTPNAAQTVLLGSQDAFVAEINAAGTAMLYVTYLGGTGSDVGLGIAVDSSGDAYITGVTNSSDFPPMNALMGQTNPYNDIFVSELGPGGGSLLFSTYLGGSGNPTGNGGSGSGDYATAIALDGSDNICICGSSTSPDFPTTPNAYQIGPSNGYGNVIVAKINPTTPALLYSTYLGGSIYEAGQGIALDSGGNIYLTGYTVSPDFPVLNAPQSVLGGAGGYSIGNTYDAFVVELNASGSALVYSTFLGGSVTDMGKGIAVDSSGNAYVTGITSSTNFPTQNPYQANLSFYANAFFTEVAAGGTSFVYSTFLGGSGNGYGIGDYGYGVAVDNQGYAYVTGYTGSADFPAVDAIQPNLATFATAFITQFDPSGTGILYSTFVGGTTYDQATAIAVDNNGNAYITGYTGSGDFPVSGPPPQPNLMGHTNAFIAEISQPLPPTATPSFTSTTTPTETPTFTITLTETETATFTPTPTETETLTNTETPTPSETPTESMTPTASFTTTPTPTETETPTPSFTFTITNTPTFTSTFTPTPTATSTFTATFSFTPTVTNTPTFTTTFTITPTPTITATPTHTATFTVTSTPTSTSTPEVLTVSVGPPYPNPIQGPGSVTVPILAPYGSQAELSVYTLAFRKIYDKTQPIPVLYDFPWDLKDNWGHPVSNGLYYVRVQVIGPQNATQIYKLLVLR